MHSSVHPCPGRSTTFCSCLKRSPHQSSALADSSQTPFVQLSSPLSCCRCFQRGWAIWATARTPFKFILHKQDLQSSIQQNMPLQPLSPQDEANKTSTKALCAIKEGKKVVHLYQKIPGSQGKVTPRRELQEKILPQQQSALKWGLREMQLGSTHSSHTAELPSPVLLALTRSFPPVLNQWFRLGLNSSHTETYP
uniref:Uncharacterized protein n=1 Tax=Coturnix japonica TaxID=93934 RepID=A0A8C2YGS9_COTJA